MKANNYDVALHQMQHLIKAGVKLPTSIRSSEKNMYHVVLIMGKDFNERTLDVKVDYIVKPYHKTVWEKQRKHLAGIGITEHFILHDPTIKVEKPKKAKPIKAEDPKAEEPKEEVQADETDLMAMNIQDLKELAIAQGYEGKLTVGKKVFVDYLQSL